MALHSFINGISAFTETKRCTVCQCSDKELPTDCPEAPVDESVRDMLSRGVIDFKKGRWLYPKGRDAYETARYEHTPPAPPAPPPEVFTEFYVCTIADANGDERLLAVPTPSGVVPLITPNGERLPLLKGDAQKIANKQGITIKVVRFTQREETDVIAPQLVQPVSSIIRP
jgi:hypothetical protein